MKLYSLNKLFSSYTFETPDYQRGYAWKDEHVKAFWDDIGRISSSNPMHFTGTLILESEADEHEHKMVVDGQQRLTTAVLLIASIVDELDIRGRNLEATTLRKVMLGSRYSPKFRYNESHDSWPYLARKLFQDMSYAAQSHYESVYTKNLDRAFALFKNKLKVLSDSQIDIYLHRLKNNLLFNVITVDPKVFNIHVAFETINHRGKSLTKLELLKNRLIYLTCILEIPDSEVADARDKNQDKLKIQKHLRVKVNETWREIYTWLGREGSKQLDEEEFLRVHTRVYFHVNSSEANWMDKLLFEDEFSTNFGSVITTSFLNDYLDKLCLGAKIWSHMHYPRGMPEQQMLQLDRISRVHKPLFDPIIMAAYFRFLENKTDMQANFCNIKDDVSLVALLEQIERYNFLVFLLSMNRSHVGRPEFYRMAYELYAKKNKFSGDAESALNWLTRYVKASICNVKKVNEDETVEYIDAEFGWPGWLNTDQFSQKIKQALREKDGYYGTSTLTHTILYEYEEWLKAQGKNSESKVSWGSIGESIEHIFPQDDEFWKELSRSISPRNIRAQISPYLNSLGNLMVLNMAKNASLGKQPYRPLKKGDKNKRDRYHSGSYSEIDVATKYPKWDKAAIIKRGIDLLKFVERRWCFSFKTKDIDNYEILLIGKKSAGSK